MMFDRRNHAQSSWRSVATIGSIPASSSSRLVLSFAEARRGSMPFVFALVAFLLTACTSYYEEFADEYGYGKSSKGYELNGTTLTDLRDEHAYNVAKVGNLYWMLDNVAYKFYRNHDEEDKADCPRPSERTCVETGFLYPGTKLDYVCPNGWRLPSYEEWEEFYNSSAFRNYSLVNDVYKGYMSGDRSLNKDGEAAYFWTNDEEDGNHYRKCVSFTPESGSFQIAGPCHEQWKLAVRCVLDAGEANVVPSSSEQNAVEKDFDCSVTDGVKVVYPEGGETFALGEVVSVVFGSDLKGGFGIELRSSDGLKKVDLLDGNVASAVTDGKTCNVYDVVLDASYGVWTTEATSADKPFINVYSYLNPSKMDRTGSFDIKFFESESSESTETVLIDPCKTGTEDSCLYDSFTDERDEQTYKMVLVGKTLWMAENLRYEKTGGCYGENASMCDEYGSLYSWKNAVTSCPTGWRLPTKEDFESLMSSIGGIDVAGAKLMAQEGWKNSNGTDEYGLTMLPGGLFDGGAFSFAGERAYFWTSTEYNSSVAYSMVLLGEENAYLNLSDKNSGLSVRCVFDR